MFSVYTRMVLYECGKHTCLSDFKVKDSSQSLIALNTSVCTIKCFRAIIKCLSLPHHPSLIFGLRLVAYQGTLS